VRLYELLEAASHVSARSLQGATFQIMCARAEVDMTSNADASDVRETSKRRVLPLLDGAMRGLSDQASELPHARQYVMSPKLAEDA
jgi:hypothetical protein